MRLLITIAVLLIYIIAVLFFVLWNGQVEF